MSKEFENEWERELDARLKSLPEMEAPTNLIANVMGIIEQRSSLAWYRRPYYTWTSSTKVAMGVMSALLGVLIFAGYRYGMDAASMSTVKMEIGQRIGSALEIANGLKTGLAAVGRVALGQYAIALLILTSVVCGLAFGTGTAVWKLLRPIETQRFA